MKWLAESFHTLKMDDCEATNQGNKKQKEKDN